MNKKNIIFIISIIIFIVLITLVIIIRNNNLKNSEDTDRYVKDTEIENINKYRNKIQTLNNVVSYNTVRTCLQKFYIYYAQMYNEDIINNINNTSLNLDYYKGKVYEFLSEEYIKRNEITKENIDTKLEKIEDINVEIYNIYYITNYEYVNEDYSIKNDAGEIEAYLVKGILREKNSSKSKEFNAIIYMDTFNSTFEIDLDTYNDLDYSTLQDGEDIGLSLPENITKRGFNKYSLVSTTYEDFSSMLFDNIRNLLLYDIDKAYELLSDEGKSSFKTVDELKNYVETNRKNILLMSFKIYEQKISDGVTTINMYDNNSKFILKVKLDAISSFRFSIENL